mgnify:FL=1
MFLDTLQAVPASGAVRAALAFLLLALVATDVVLGLRQHRTFRLEIDATPAPQRESLRIALLRRWIRLGVASGLITLLAVVLLPGLTLADLGLRAPDLESKFGPVTSSMVAGMFFGIVVSAVAVAFLTRRVLKNSSKVALAGSEALDPMLPRTARGRWWWGGLALSAGVTEEIVYRGLAILTLAVILPQASGSVIVMAATVIFGLAHAYQGWAGVLVTGLSGWVLGNLYLSTSSLVIPMVLHVLIDLRVLVMRPSCEIGAESDSGTQISSTPIGKPVLS